MRRIFKFIQNIIFSLTILPLSAQIPINDSAWVIQTSASEEFNSSLDFIYKWEAETGPHGSAEICFDTNLIQTGTTLKIRVDTLKPGIHVSPNEYADPDSAGVTFVYQGGRMHSRPVGGNDVYKFGYLEIEAKYPTSSYSLWPAFWLWSASCVSYYNEIDIAENSAPVSYNGHQIGTYVHLNNDTCAFAIDYGDPITVTPLLSDTFHKYAVEWGPDRVIWYFDDMSIREFYDADGDSIPQNAMSVILNFSIQTNYAFLPADWNDSLQLLGGNPNSLPVSFPKDFEINYLRYYKLNTNYCDSVLTICSPHSDYSNRAVEKSITTGGGCSLTFNTSDEYTLRATDYVLLDAGTTINPNSSGYFAIQTLVCPR